MTACITCSISRMVTPESRIVRIDGDDLDDLARDEARHDLVEQQELGFRGQRARELQALAAGNRQRFAG